MSDEGRKWTKEEIEGLQEKARELVREGGIPTLNPETGEVTYMPPVEPAPSAGSVPAPSIAPATGEPGLVSTSADRGTPPARQLAAQKQIEYLARLDGRVRRKHTRIVEMMALGAEIDTGAPKPEGWTDREYRISQDARNGPREAPMYLAASQKIFESFLRAEVMSDHDPAPRLNCDIQVFVQQNVYNYETLVVEDK